jgi:cytochrome c oxidase subunit 2
VDETLVLPVDHQVWVRINSTDVLHSFWIPAFRQKVDVVPGRTTELTFEPIALGDFADDAAYRLQCAELCGRDHTFMMMPVRVVEEAEFEAWLAEKSGEE